jgi:hypothetical protein
MQGLKARVHNGRYVIDEPTDLPEGTELYLVRADGEEVAWANEATWPEQKRNDLEDALQRGTADVAAGRTVDAREFLAKLRTP